MANKNWEVKKIAIRDLILWDENSRVPDYLLGGNQEELIQILLKKYDLESFANEIIKDFDLPQLEKIVVWKNKNKYVVLEGNRRLAIYKCLINPDFVKDDSLRKKFEALKNRISINDKLQLEAVITSNKKEGMRYIERKHYHGNNEKKWEQYERDHHIKRTRDVSKDGISAKERESIFRANLGEKVKLVGLPDEMKHKILGKGFATTFYRVIGSTQARKKLKYERLDYDLFIENQKEFLSLLEVIVYNILHKETLDGRKKLNSRTLNEDSEIKEYLDSISTNDAKEVDRLIEMEQKRMLKIRKLSKKSPEYKQEMETRKKTLLEKDWITDTIYKTYPKQNRIKAILKELKRLKPHDQTNVCAICLRVLLELSTYSYLKDRGHIKKIIKKEKDKIQEKNKKSKTKQYLPKYWSPDFKQMLLYMVEEGIIDDPKDQSAIKTYIDKNSKQPFLKELNNFIHSISYVPSPTDVSDIWRKFGKLLFEIVSK